MTLARDADLANEVRDVPIEIRNRSRRDENFVWV